MAKFGISGVGALHPHIEAAPAQLRCVVTEEGVRTLGEHILEGVGISDEGSYEIPDDGIADGIVFGDGFDQFSSDPEMLAMHITDAEVDKAILYDLGGNKAGEPLLIEPPANEGYMGYL